VRFQSGRTWLDDTSFIPFNMDHVLQRKLMPSLLFARCFCRPLCLDFAVEARCFWTHLYFWFGRCCVCLFWYWVAALFGSVINSSVFSRYRRKRESKRREETKKVSSKHLFTLFARVSCIDSDGLLVGSFVRWWSESLLQAAFWRPTLYIFHDEISNFKVADRKACLDKVWSSNLHI
jgi:hypothetical protein